MSIEITNLQVGATRNRDNANSNPVEKGSSQSNRSTETARAEVRSEEVRLSDDAKLARQLQEKLEKEDSFDRERVDRIRDAISNGNYPIDDQKLASKFAELESLL